MKKAYVFGGVEIVAIVWIVLLTFLTIFVCKDMRKKAIKDMRKKAIKEKRENEKSIYFRNYNKYLETKLKFDPCCNNLQNK